MLLLLRPPLTVDDVCVERVCEGALEVLRVAELLVVLRVVELLDVLRVVVLPEVFFVLLVLEVLRVAELLDVLRVVVLRDELPPLTLPLSAGRCGVLIVALVDRVAVLVFFVLARPLSDLPPSALPPFALPASWVPPVGRVVVTDVGRVSWLFCPLC